jgi:hypothetical protein
LPFDAVILSGTTFLNTSHSLKKTSKTGNLATPVPFRKQHYALLKSGERSLGAEKSRKPLKHVLLENTVTREIHFRAEVCQPSPPPQGIVPFILIVASASLSVIIAFDLLPVTARPRAVEYIRAGL